MSKKGEPREPIWTPDEIRFLRENYIRVPVAEIAANLGRSYESVRRKASKVGVQHQEWGEKFTPEEDGLLIERYAVSRMSEMTALLGRHHNSIRRRASMLGLTNESQVRRRAIAAGIRHDYFSQVDSPMQAYVLGLLASDGCVSCATNSIHLKVAQKDIELAELVRDEISPHSYVYSYTQPPLPGYSKERHTASLSVSSAQMKADLGRIGIVPRKTFTLRWPHLAAHLTAAFVLGCFDGDGMLHLSARPGAWQWALYSASEPFLESAQAAIHQDTGLELKRSTSKRGLHQLRLDGGRRIEVLDAWLHADLAGLSRKRLEQGAYARAREEIRVRHSETARQRMLREGDQHPLRRRWVA